MAPELPKKIFGAVLCNQPLHHCPTKAEMANLQLRVWDEVRDKAHSSGKLGVLSFKSTQERPCLCFPLSHFLLSHRSRAGLFQSWQFKEERSHSMNSPWICCRDLFLLPTCKVQGAAQRFWLWILQGLIKVVFATTTCLGGDGPHLPHFCEMWNS